MIDEETVRQQARQALDRIDVEDVKSDQVVRDIKAEMWRFRQPLSKALFLDEAVHYVQAEFDKHLPICKLGDACMLNKSFKSTLFSLQEEIDSLPQIKQEEPVKLSLEYNVNSPLTHLHPTLQKVATSRFATAHYSDAILAACTALDKAVQVKAQLPTSTVGTALMTKAFSANQPLIRLAQDTNEQMGFMNLYQGSVQAIRNHYAHNLTTTDPARALEWLSFISALFYKLDDAQPASSSPIP